MPIVTLITIMAACGVLFLALAVAALSIEFWNRVRPDPAGESVDDAATTGTWRRLD